MIDGVLGSQMVMYRNIYNSLYYMFTYTSRRKIASHEPTPSFMLVDARVPRLGGSDHEDSPSTDMTGYTFLPQPQGNNMDPTFDLGLDTTSSLSGGGMISSGGGDISSCPYPSPGPPLSMTVPMPIFQPQGPFFEPVVEMPAPLANPMIKKVNRSSRLNDKYARMKVRTSFYCNNG